MDHTSVQMQETFFPEMFLQSFLGHVKDRWQSTANLYVSLHHNEISNAD